MRSLLLISCFVGGGFWLSVDSIGSFPVLLQGKVTLAHAEEDGSPASFPEIDLQVPESTEIALFALG